MSILILPLLCALASLASRSGPICAVNKPRGDLRAYRVEARAGTLRMRNASSVRFPASSYAALFSGEKGRGPLPSLRGWCGRCRSNGSSGLARLEGQARYAR